jgi:hypothetical protein
VTALELSNADIFDLAAGFSFNTVDARGQEVILYGDDFDEDDIATLAAGKKLTWQGNEDDYALSAPEKPWHGHHDDDELAEIWAGPYGPRLALIGLIDPLAPPDTATPGPRLRLSSLAGA